VHIGVTGSNHANNSRLLCCILVHCDNKDLATGLPGVQNVSSPIIISKSVRVGTNSVVLSVKDCHINYTYVTVLVQISLTSALNEISNGSEV
jgi:hypothetical protein